MEEKIDKEKYKMEQALRLIAYSRHTGQPRFGTKAQIARWGLGEGDLPKEEQEDEQQTRT